MRVAPILSVFCHNNKMASFAQIVDYGAKDKDLIYVPILYEEDSFTSSGSAGTTEKPPASPKIKPKLTSYVKKGGATLAAIEVVPDVAKSAMDKVSNLINNTTNFANDTIDKVASVKEHYRERFPNPKNSDTSEKSPSTEDNDSDVYSAIGPKSPDTAENEHIDGLSPDISEHQIPPHNPEPDEEYDDNPDALDDDFASY